MQLGAPGGVRGVLAPQHLAKRGGHRGLAAGIPARFAAEPGDRVLSLAQRLVIPSLNGRAAEPDGLSVSTKIDGAIFTLFDGTSHFHFPLAVGVLGSGSGTRSGFAATHHSSGALPPSPWDI